MKSSIAQLVLITIAVLLAAGAYVLWYRSISDMSTNVAALQNQIEMKTQAATRLATVRAALTELAGDEAAVQNYFVSQAQVVGFINDLEARARAQGVTMTTLSVAAANSGTHPALTLALNVKGPFDAVMRAIGVIEYAPYDISITSLVIGADGKGVWHADLTILVGSAPAHAPQP